MSLCMNPLDDSSSSTCLSTGSLLSARASEVWFHAPHPRCIPRKTNVIVPSHLSSVFSFPLGPPAVLPGEIGGDYHGQGTSPALRGVQGCCGIPFVANGFHQNWPLFSESSPLGG